MQSCPRASTWLRVIAKALAAPRRVSADVRTSRTTSALIARPSRMCGRSLQRRVLICLSVYAPLTLSEAREAPLVVSAFLLYNAREWHMCAIASGLCRSSPDPFTQVGPPVSTGGPTYSLVPPREFET